jgi:ABC-type enterochelin transport system permease subunit
MNSKQVMTVAVLVAVLTWSTVMAVVGQLAAVAALLPSLGLLIQQIISALSGTGPRSGAAAASLGGTPPGSEGPSR